jgi:hypothetical protein
LRDGFSAIDETSEPLIAIQISTYGAVTA